MRLLLARPSFFQARACPQIGQLQAGKETPVLLLPSYLPLTDGVSLELLKKLEIEMTGKEMLPLTDAQCHLNYR